MKDGGPAFPHLMEHCQRVNEDETHPGMSLRDWFAGQAQIGLLSNTDLPDLFKKGFAPSKSAEICYAIADAMIAEKDKNK